jgi:replication initiation and membrane attachment protein DnaB
MTLENVDPQHRGTLNKIAEKYEMSVEQLMTFQNLYLTTNGYLK